MKVTRHSLLIAVLLGIMTLGLGPALVWSDEPPPPNGSVFVDRSSRIPCFVVGEVSWAKEDMEPKSHLMTGCPIHVRRIGKHILLSSSRWKVEIAIPEDPRSLGFLYVWGQPTATIGTRSVSVAYGPVDGI